MTERVAVHQECWELRSSDRYSGQVVVFSKIDSLTQNGLIRLRCCENCAKTYATAVDWVYEGLEDKFTPLPIDPRINDVYDLVVNNTGAHMRHNDIDSSVSRAIAIADKSDLKPVQIKLPGYNSSVALMPLRQGMIRVAAHQSILIDNLLYTHDGLMKQHEDERWYFISAATIIPTLAPKKKTDLVNAISEAVNAYLVANPGYMDIFDVVARKQEIDGVKQSIENLERNHRQVLHNIGLQEASLGNYERDLVQQRAKLQGLLDADASTEQDVADATSVEGTVIEADPIS